ncbi:MAG: type II secretion system F family protein [Bacilli bacterium]|nr:type II secretion system F family protein [Bacilli bacterium]
MFSLLYQINQTDIGLLLILFLMLIFFLWLLFQYIKSVKLEKRLGKYSINSEVDSKISFSDNISLLTNKAIKSLSKILSNLNVKGKFYTKYIGTFSSFYEKETDFIATKIMFSLMLLFTVLISQIFILSLTNIYTIVLALIIGYFVLDIIYIVRYNNYRKQLESDFLNSIVIMNSAFKAGKSISQAIEIVGLELKGNIGKEFSKMSLELNCGLSIETIFKRFSERIKLDEINYLASSLIVLNKTGGNIIKIFHSIERNLYNKKKLRQEYKTITSASKLLIYILFCVPLVFVLVINIINPGYFKVLLESLTGLIMLFIMVFVYLIYIYTVYKTMRVKV